MHTWEAFYSFSILYSPFLLKIEINMQRISDSWILSSNCDIFSQGSRIIEEVWEDKG